MDPEQRLQLILYVVFLTIGATVMGYYLLNMRERNIDRAPSRHDLEKAREMGKEDDWIRSVADRKRLND
jgi:hypothetical protein